MTIFLPYFMFIFLMTSVLCQANDQTVMSPTPTSTKTSHQKANASSEKILLGHNLSPTSYTLKKNKSTVGTYVLGYGITDQLTLVTSPWLFLNYNMYNLGFRYSFFNNQTWQLSAQLAYFKSTKFYTRENYIMESLNPILTASYLTGKTEYHFSANYMYFFDETIPFSLRREPLNDDAWQLSASLLIETELMSSLSMLGEVGVLGLNYEYPQLIIGASLNKRTDNWQFQGGISVTGTPRAYFSSERVDAQAFLSRNSQGSLTQAPYFVRRDFSVHPEIQIQRFF